MAAPNRVDQPSSPTTGQDPGVAPDQDPTQLLSKMFAGATLGLGVPTDDAPNHISLQPPPAAAGASVSPTADPDPGVTASYNDGITRVLTSLLTNAPFAAPLPVPPLTNILAQPPPVPGTPAFSMSGRDPEAPSYRTRTRPDITELLEKLVGEAAMAPTTPSSRAAVRAVITARALESAGGSPALIRKRYGMPDDGDGKPDPAGGGHAERAARRREERRLFSVPTDYLRTEQESRERRRRREMVRRNVRRIFSIHKDRSNDRFLSTMMARQATLEPVAPPAAGDGKAAASENAAAPSSEDPELGEMLMELSFKD